MYAQVAGCRRGAIGRPCRRQGRAVAHAIHRKKHNLPRGFSLVELLVVLGILAILVGLLLPALRKVRQRFIFRSSKTEHHADGGIRVVPMFPELVGHFQAVFNAAPEGSTHVITRYRNPAQNLRTQLVRYIVAAVTAPENREDQAAHNPAQGRKWLATACRRLGR